MDGDATHDDLAEAEPGTETDSFLPVLPEESNAFQKKFDVFLNQQPSWNNSATVVLFWKNYPAEHYKNIMVIRKQMSGLCFMHAPVVLQHYLLCIYRIKRGKALDFKMINIAAYIKDNWKAKVLERYLAFDHGGSSLKFFKDISVGVINYRK